MGQNTDLIENPAPRCACALVLDVSHSMEGAKIAELNEGARQFVKEVRDDEFARYSVELGVFTFGGEVTTQLDFGPLGEIVEWDDFEASGNTPMGRAVDRAIDALERRKNEYKKNGVSYYQPWLVLMTDGIPTDNYQGAAERLRKMANDKKVVVFGIGIGAECDMEILGMFCPDNRAPAKLDGMKFKEFFSWLSQSMSRVSQSTPGAGGITPPDASGWMSIEL